MRASKDSRSWNRLVELVPVIIKVSYGLVLLGLLIALLTGPPISSTQLGEAAENGDLAEVQRLIEEARR